jgi:hypothetical protein
MILRSAPNVATWPLRFLFVRRSVVLPAIPRGWQAYPRARFSSDAVDVSANRLPERIGKQRSVVEDPDVERVEERLDRFRVADASDPFGSRPGRSRTEADDLAGVTVDEAGHRRTIPPTAFAHLLSWFRLCRGRETHRFYHSFMDEYIEKL